MTLKNCLIVDDLHKVIVPKLLDIGIESSYQPQIKREEILKIIQDYDILLVRSKTVVDKEMLDAAPNLKVIGRAGAGVDQIDEAEVKKRNIMLLNAPEGNRVAVGEHTVGMLLALFNNFVRAHKQVSGLQWMREYNRGYEVAGKTIGIIGYGNMGKAFAKCLSGFDSRVIAYDVLGNNYGDQYAKEVTLDTIYKEADVLSLHIPLTNENNQWIGEQFFNQFQKPIWFLNTARGKIVNLKGLIAALKSGKVLGAALDVLENEKMNTFTDEEKEIHHTLSHMDQVLFTPHVGGWTHESYRKISEVLADKLAKLVD